MVAATIPGNAAEIRTARGTRATGRMRPALYEIMNGDLLISRSPAGPKPGKRRATVAFPWNFSAMHRSACRRRAAV
jgi:hypothetical protein